jgi:hypothetical protein
MALGTVPQIEVLRAGILYNGLPLSYGTVMVYQAGGTTPVQLSSDSNGSGDMTNPIQLDSNGRAVLFSNASYSEYKFVYFDKNGVQVSSQDYLSYIPISSASAATLYVENPNVSIPHLQARNSPTTAGYVPISTADTRNFGLQADGLYSGAVSYSHSSTIVASQIARLDVANILNGNQTITSGRVNLDNNQNLTVKDNGGTVRNGLICDATVTPVAIGTLQVGDPYLGMNLNASGGATPAFTINGYPLSSLVPALMKSKVIKNSDGSWVDMPLGSTWGSTWTWSGTLGFTPVSMQVLSVEHYYGNDNFYTGQYDGTSSNYSGIEISTLTAVGGEGSISPHSIVTTMNSGSIVISHTLHVSAIHSVQIILWGY